MPRTSRRTVCTLSLLAIAAVSACGGHHHDDGPTCQPSALNGATWAGAVGAGVAVAWVGVAGVGYGAWYDPGDDYVPGAPEPVDGWDDDDGTTASGDPGGDTSGDDTTGGDTSAGDGTDTGGDTQSLRPRSVRIRTVKLADVPQTPFAASATRDADGCWSCTVGCSTGNGTTATGRQAVGASGASYDEACRSAVHVIERWAHDTQSAKIVQCQQQVADSSSSSDGGRAAAAPTVGR